MIRVSRNRRDESGRRISPGREWFRRSRAARARVVQHGGEGQNQFDPNIYGADRVRASLSKLFCHKCAYCEFPLDRTDLNVEHYRPKAAVSEAPAHPGYYWLAYEWSNLLPACEFCNQVRRGPPVWPDATRGTSSGKGNSFPLVNEHRRAYSPFDQLSLEEPLLVNPTVDEPSHHITFDPFGSPVPKTRKGEVSIAVYNLNTRQLNIQRKRVIAHMTSLLKLKESARSVENQAYRRQQLRIIKDEMRQLTSRSAWYSAAALAVARNPTAFGL